MSDVRNAYYVATARDFIRADPDAVYGKLSRHHGHAQEQEQKAAWLEQIELLQAGLATTPDAWLALEMTIPRMGKRADAVVLLGGIVFVLEFKVGAEAFTAAAIAQVTDYALDLKNFHAGSHDRIIIPVVVADQARPRAVQLNLWPDDVAEPIFSNGADLGVFLQETVGRFGPQPPLDPMVWLGSGYKPTPTIIEAAQALYREHQVEEIINSAAGKKNLTVTTTRLNAIIDDAKARHQKVICFVTGVPGAGKTLAGLNLITQRTQAHGEEHAVFLSGNGPLVEVLREALARDRHDNGDENGLPVALSTARREVMAFIQNIHHFRDHYFDIPDLPDDHVVAFDEAQRAWNRDKLAQAMREKHGKRDFDKSEPELLLGIMDRRTDWCAVICLVGGGQEINDGEAGLSEWFMALARHYSDWRVFTSDHLAHDDYSWDHDLAAMIAGMDHSLEPDLHLSVSVRSFRAEKLSAFIDAVVAGRDAMARETYATIQAQYPIALTRDLSVARGWLRGKARGSERFGLVASSGALRLKPDGIYAKARIDAPNWFLNGKDDVRASYYLEDVATEFAIQGLELDWVGVCWDADFRRAGASWTCHDFQGTKWRNVHDPSRLRYHANAYRVLLTRARQGMVIYVPAGDAADPTRPPEIYDGIAEFLGRCGIATL
ncbi:MAG TPA: DUF2075 domain-containing protein [Rhizomicrobium sp.]|nr:DUF2075 domain-containing protein [Rhizomicrobium sp.]